MTCAKRNYQRRNGMVIECIPTISQLCRRSILWEAQSHANGTNNQLLHAEITRLHATLKQKEQDCANHLAAIAELRQSGIRLEQKLAEVSRELFLLQAENHSCFHPSMPPEIPVTPLKKDAIYWHQTCRTLQMQNALLKRELDHKTEQCARLTEAYRVSPRGMEISKDTQASSTDSST